MKTKIKGPFDLNGDVTYWSNDMGWVSEEGATVFSGMPTSIPMQTTGIELKYEYEGENCTFDFDKIIIMDDGFEYTLPFNPHTFSLVYFCDECFFWHIPDDTRDLVEELL